MNNDEIIKFVRLYSLLSEERLINNIESVQYILDNNIEGDVVEIGVYKGGSVMSMILSLQRNNEVRNVHLYDTFEGMTEATDIDTTLNGWHYNDAVKSLPFWKCESPLEEVTANINLTNYDKTLIHYHVGDIVHTTYFPNKISLLRLDTDFYESTKYELEHFYPLVVSGGIIIIDDYGHWNGSRKATDDFLKDKPSIIIHKIDNEGIYFYKP